MFDGDIDMSKVFHTVHRNPKTNYLWDSRQTHARWRHLYGCRGALEATRGALSPPEDCEELLERPRSPRVTEERY